MSAESCLIRIEKNFILSLLRHADGIIRSRDGRKVQDNNESSPLLIDTLEREHALLVVLVLDPRISVIRCVDFPEPLIRDIEFIERLDIGLHGAVHGILQEEEIQTLPFIPFNKLTEFATHKGELLPRECVHIGVEKSQRGEFIVIIARHFVEKRFFSVDNLIV